MRARISFLLIGIIVGGAVSYGITQVYPLPFLEDFLPNPYKVKYDELAQRYQNISSQHEEVSSKLEDLQDDFNQLDQEHLNLANSFNDLSEEYDDLLFTYNETLESYESLLMQYLIVTGSSPLTPQPLSNDTIRKDFAWVYAGETWTLSLYIPKNLYLYYTNKTRVPTEDYSVYVTHPYDDEYLSTIIDKFKDIVLSEGYDETQEVELVIAFVQSLPYTPDDVSTGFDDYPRYPMETLVDGGGDCEDTSILSSALLDTMDIGVVLLNLPEHVAIGVAVDAYGAYWIHEGTKYFYTETTGEGWEIGELPDEYKEASAYVYPIIPVPVCTHHWTASRLRHKLTLVADVQNLGTAEAKGIKLFAAFEGDQGEIWNPVESVFFDLDIGDETTIMLELNEPRNEHVRLIVHVLDPWGNIMDESYSEWFDTD